jgi:enediyne biosynthesis protein E7
VALLYLPSDDAGNCSGAFYPTINLLGNYCHVLCPRKTTSQVRAMSTDVLQGSTLRAMARLAESGPGIRKYRGGGEEAFLVTSTTAIRQVLIDNWRNYERDTRVHDNFRVHVSDGLFTASNSDWLMIHESLRPFLSARSASRHVSSMAFEAKRVAETWLADGSAGKPIDPCPDLAALSLEIVADSLLGLGMGWLDAKSFAAGAAPHVRHLVSPTEQFREVAAATRAHVYRLVEPFMRNPAAAQGSMLAALIANFPNDIERVVDHTMTFLLAGFETTASSLAWTFYLLAANPGFHRAVTKETKDVLHGDVPSSEALRNLSTIRSVVFESLRLFPAAWILGRRARLTDQLDGIDIPPDSVIAISPYILQRGSLWSEAESFLPSRWHGHFRPGGLESGFLAFGAGPRACAGYHWALTELITIVATIASEVIITLVPGSVVKAHPAYVLRPRDGLQVYVSPAR